MGLETMAVSEKIAYLSDDSFESDVLQADKPCAGRLLGRMVRPLQDDCADPRRNRRRIRPADRSPNSISTTTNTPPKYGIRGIPTLMLFKGGEVEATKVGILSKVPADRISGQQYLARKPAKNYCPKKGRRRLLDDP